MSKRYGFIWFHLIYILNSFLFLSVNGWNGIYGVKGYCPQFINRRKIVFNLFVDVEVEERGSFWNGRANNELEITAISRLLLKA